MAEIVTVKIHTELHESVDSVTPVPNVKSNKPASASMPNIKRRNSISQFVMAALTPTIPQKKCRSKNHHAVVSTAPSTATSFTSPSYHFAMSDDLGNASLVYSTSVDFASLRSVQSCSGSGHSSLSGQKNVRVVGRGGVGSRPRLVERREPDLKFTSPPPTPNVSTSFANMPHKAIVKQATAEGVRLVGRGGRGSKPRKARDTGGENGNVTSTDLEPRETLPLQPAAPIISSTSATVPTIITTLTHPLSPSLKSPPTSPVSSSFPKSSKRPAPLSRVPGPATPVAPPLLSPSIASSSKSSTKPEVIRYSGRGGAGSKPRKVKEKVKPLEEEQTKPISKGIPTIKTSIKFSWKGKGKIKLPQRSDFIPSSLQAVGDVDETSFDDSSSIQSSIHFGGIPPILNTQAIPHWPQSYDRNMPFASDVHEKRRKPSQFGMGKLARLLGTTSIPIQRQSSISSFSPSFATVSEDIHTDGLQRSSHASSRISYQNSNRSSGWGGEDLHKFDLNLDDDISIEERQKRRSTQTATSVSPIMFSDRPPAELLANQDTDHSISEEALSAHDFIQSSRHEGSPRYSDSSSQSSQPTTPHNAIPLHHPSSSTPSIMGSSSMVETPMSKPLSRRQIYSPSSMPTIIPKSPIDAPFGAYGAHLHPTGHQTPAFKFDLQEPQLYSGGHAYDLDYASDQNMDAETETISDLSSDCHIEFAKEHDAEPHPYRDLGAMAQKASKLDRRRSNADWSGQWNRDNMQDVISTLRSLR